MSENSPANSHRVAIFGSGPSGFYAAQALLADKERPCRVDLFDRLPVPHGLVRYGVAPDHLKIKSVTRIYDKTAKDPRFRFFGGVEYGTQLTLEELSTRYHQILFCTGAQTDRRLGIPGEDLTGSHPATEFVAWYNGHPDFTQCAFDLSQETAVVIGVGNVAVDVARILCRTREELEASDIADYALEALANSSIKRVLLVGRRGPAQAAFTNPEVKELGELADARAVTFAEEMKLDPISQSQIEEDRGLQRKIDILTGMLEPKDEDASKSRTLEIRFLLSPTEIIGDDQGRVRAVTLTRNQLVDGGNGRLRAESTDASEQVPAGLVFRSVGYRGVPLPGIPFRDDWGIIPNDEGRVTETIDGSPIRGLYVAGWIKRGPSGVIGTNKPDSVATVAHMLSDYQTGSHLAPTDAGDIAALLRTKGIRSFSYADWLKIDQHEQELGSSRGRPRHKLTSAKEMQAVFDS